MKLVGNFLNFISLFIVFTIFVFSLNMVCAVDMSVNDNVNRLIDQRLVNVNCSLDSRDRARENDCVFEEDHTGYRPFIPMPVIHDCDSNNNSSGGVFGCFDDDSSAGFVKDGSGSVKRLFNVSSFDDFEEFE